MVPTLHGSMFLTVQLHLSCLESRISFLLLSLACSIYRHLSVLLLREWDSFDPGLFCRFY